MEKHKSYKPYISPDISVPVSDLLQELHLSSADSEYCPSSRQSVVQTNHRLSFTFDSESRTDSPHTSSFESSLPKSWSSENSKRVPHHGIGIDDSSYKKYSKPLSRHSTHDERYRLISSAREYQESQTSLNYYLTSKLEDEAKRSHGRETDIMTRDKQSSLPSYSDSKSSHRTYSGRYISNYYTSKYGRHENYFERLATPNVDYARHLDPSVYSCDMSIRSSEHLPSSYSLNESYDHQKPYYGCNVAGDKLDGETNGYIYDALSMVKNEKHAFHDPEDQEYACNYELSALSSLNTKETVEILGPEEVRWFYKTEGDKKWTPFIGYDSIKIEWAYRDFVHKSVIEEKRPNVPCASMDPGCVIQEPEIPQNERPIVCGGLYEVDVSSLKGYSIYWKGEEFIIMRGTWFYEGSWLPVEAIIASHIEMEHLIKFRGSTVYSSLPEKESQQVVHSLTLNEGEVDWYSASDIYFSHDATPSRLMRSVSRKLGLQKTGYKLHRGYCLDASSDDKPPDITHIVFVIHGIGQKMETGRIIKNCTSLRENVKWLKEKQFGDNDFSQQTIEFFPVEWRSSLMLDPGIIESITPHKIIGLRQMLNASFMDIMYYNSPQYREEIVNGLATELNRLYSMFTARNPYFEATGGKVSVIAHSLGCVITYDIATGWSPAPQMSQNFLQALINLSQRNVGVDGESALKSFQSALQHVLQQQLEKSSQPRLIFKIENFFCLGSPLSVFLGLRRMRQDKGPPAPFLSEGNFKRFFNIFHPADPVAYRIEPLICPKFSSVVPMVIHSYTATDKLPYDDIPPESLSLSPRPYSRGGGETSSDPTETESPTPTTIPTTPNKGTAAWNFWNFMKQPKKGADATLSSKSVEDDLSEALKHRIDFVLREGSMESSYLSALTSHTSYWGNMDVAFFLLTTFCPNLLEKPS